MSHANEREVKIEITFDCETVEMNRYGVVDHSTYSTAQHVHIEDTVFCSVDSWRLPEFQGNMVSVNTDNATASAMQRKMCAVDRGVNNLHWHDANVLP